MNLLQSQFVTEKINTANITINNLKIRQFIITNDTHILFKLFINGISNYQVDYIIPIGLYSKEIIKVESSIGTITNKGEK